MPTAQTQIIFRVEAKGLHTPKLNISSFRFSQPHTFHVTTHFFLASQPGPLFYLHQKSFQNNILETDLF